MNIIDKIKTRLGPLGDHAIMPTDIMPIQGLKGRLAIPCFLMEIKNWFGV
ncbi:hypothetical protein J2772_003304 [Chryseobacterium jejuense]|nr:hypothetical protein [Chryseobacterium jejuense]